MASESQSLLSFSDYDAIGVDLDHTLCKYKLDNLFPVSFNFISCIILNVQVVDPQCSFFPFSPTVVSLKISGC